MKDLTKTIVTWAFYNNMESFPGQAVDHSVAKKKPLIYRGILSHTSGEMYHKSSYCMGTSSMWFK